jgi:hypothetical protein
MRLILSLIVVLVLSSIQAVPAAATVHAALYCWVPDFEIAIACDEDDEGSDGDDSMRRLAPLQRQEPVREPAR